MTPALNFIPTYNFAVAVLRKNGYPEDWMTADPATVALPWVPIATDQFSYGAWEAAVRRAKSQRRNATTFDFGEVIFALWRLSVEQPDRFEAEMVMYALTGAR